MHEHGEADRLMEQAVKMARAKGLSSITRVKIGYGVLKGLSKSALKEQLNHVAEHLAMTGIRFSFTTIKPEAVCLQCGKKMGQEYICPHCGGKNLKIIAGLDVFVKDVS